ncbi:MAG: DinB family protein [Chloroflexi bacterium]|nr:DinB family protein [Chloroflexota bacterium]
MDTGTFFLNALGRADGTLKRALEGLTREELMQQPAGPGSNPIGWLAWHLTRVQDGYGSRIAGVEQVWRTQKWYEKFGLEETPPSYKPETVGTFDPISAELLLEYYEMVKTATVGYIASLSAEDWERQLPQIDPSRPPQTVADGVAIITSDNIQHIGQIAYVRGLIKGQGWYGV